MFLDDKYEEWWEDITVKSYDGDGTSYWMLLCCPVCGAVVRDHEKHKRWHVSLAGGESEAA